MSTLTRAGVRGHRQTVGWRSCQGKWADKIHGLRGKKAFEGHLAAEPRARGRNQESGLQEEEGDQPSLSPSCFLGTHVLLESPSVSAGFHFFGFRSAMP